MKGIILTERLINKLQKKNDGGLNVFMKEVVKRNLTLVVLTKDVGRVCCNPLFTESRTKLRNLCIFRAYSGKKISSKEIAEVLAKIKAPAEDAVMVSSDEKDFSSAHSHGMEFVLFSTLSYVRNAVKKKQYRTIDKIEYVFEVIEQ